MKIRRVGAFIVALVFMGCVTFAPAASASEPEEQEEIELSNDDYRAYINNLLRPSFFSRYVVGAEDVGQGIQVTKNNFTTTNTPSPTGIVTDFAEGVLKEVIKEIFESAIVNDDTYQLPNIQQYQGKLLVTYAGDVKEVITCVQTIYQTQATSTTWNNHIILSYIRQINDYYTTFTACDIDSENLCNPNISGNLRGNFNTVVYSGYANGVSNVPAFVNGEKQAVAAYLGTYMQNRGVRDQRRTLEIYDTAANSQTYDEWSGTSFDCTTNFVNFTDSNLITCFSGGSEYRPLWYIYNTMETNINTGGYAWTIGAVFTTSTTFTNDYPQYVTQNNNKTNLQTSQPYNVNFNSTIQSNTYNVNDTHNFAIYDRTTNSLTVNDIAYNSFYDDMAQNNYDSLLNTYQNYYYYGYPETEPPPEIPTETRPTTTTTTTTTTGAIVTADTAQPPATGGTAVPKYTMDMGAVSSDFQYLKNMSNDIDKKRPFWIVRLMNKLINDTGLAPLFFFAFIISVLGVFLWK